MQKFLKNSLCLLLIAAVSLTASCQGNQAKPTLYSNKRPKLEQADQTSSDQKSMPKSDQVIERHEYHFTGQFDTVTQVLIEDQDQSVIDTIERDLNYYHQLFTPYDSYPDFDNLATVNQLASQGLATIPPDLNEVLKLAWEGAEASNGGFNPALGQLVLEWRDCRLKLSQAPDQARLPSEGEMKLLLASTDLNTIDYNPDQATIHFNNPKTKLDLGGIAKGWAVEKIAQNAAAAGAKHSLISVGGNVRAIGPKANGQGWNILIQDPFHGENPDFPQLIVSIQDESMVTSGLYERFFDYQGKRYAHILNPATGWPQDQYISITVLTANSGIADFLATALFNLDLVQGQKLVEKYQAEALWIYPNGQIEMTPGFAQRLEK